MSEMSMIKSRKRPAAGTPFADPRAVGLMLAALPGLVLAAQPEAPEQQRERVLGGVRVVGEVEGSYKADAVASPKFTQPLLDTPQTITVLKKELLQDQGVATLGEAMRNTPGITFTLGENGNTSTGDSVFMRGFDTAGSIFQDGIRDLGTVSRDVFNIEQIEIVKGPAGTDNGRGAPTGYINLVSKAPTVDDAASASLTGGNGSRIRVTGDLNEAIEGLPGTALRLNVMYDKGDKLDRDVVENERWGIAPSFALGLGADTRAYFSYLFVKQDNIPDGGISAIGLPGYTSPVLGATPAAPVDRSNYYGALTDYDHVEVNMFTARFEHDLSDSTTLRNTSRFGRTTEQYVLTGVNAVTAAVLTDPGTWTAARSRQGKDQTNEILTNQSNLTTAFRTGYIEHTVSSGIEFIYERQEGLTFSPVGTTSPANLYAPSTADSFAAVLPNGGSSDGNTITAAIYLFDTLKFSEQWSFNAGLRFERYRTEFTSVPPSTPVAAATDLEAQDGLLTGKAGLVYKPLPNGTLYVAYATSQQPPGGTNFALNATATNIANPNLDPQKATNLEIGTKWELLDNQLVVTAAAFDTRNKNDLAIADPVTQEIDQYGERQVRGVELGVSGMITPAWQVSAGIASMDTEVKEGSRTNAAQQGAQINFSPKLTFTSWTTYELPFGLTIGGGARYVDSQFTSVSNSLPAVTFLPQIPSYWVFDAMAAYDLNERVTLQFNALNLADEFYISSVNNGRSRYTLGPPRSYQLTANVKLW
jgi:catecholate siderophore receptor